MGDIITLPETAAVVEGQREKTPSLVGDAVGLSLKASRFLVGYTMELARDIAPKVTHDVLQKLGVVERPVPTDGEVYRTRLERYEQTMRDRFSFYEEENLERQRLGEELYTLEVKMGVRTSLLLADAQKWVEYAHAEQHPGPTAGPDVQGHIDNITVTLANWGLDKEIVDRLITDLNDHYQLTDARVPHVEPS